MTVARRGASGEQRIPLEQAHGVLERMTNFDTLGFALIDSF